MNAAAPALLLLTYVSVLALPPALCTARRESLSSVGTKFVVSFVNTLQTIELDDRNTLNHLYVSTPESHNVDITVTSAYSDTVHTCTVEPHKDCFLDVRAIFGIMDDYPEKGILISSSDGVSKLAVMGFIQFKTHSVDAFTVFPSHHYASYSYYGITAASIDHTNSNKAPAYTTTTTPEGNFLLLVAAEDDTRVNITATLQAPVNTSNINNGNCSGILQPGATCTVTLQKLETVLLKSSDITGTRVDSNRPLSVFAGDECATVPSGYGKCELFYEQVPPVVTWGKTFLLGPLEERMFFGEVYKIISAGANTDVDVYCVNQNDQKDRFDLRFSLVHGGSAHKFVVGNKRMCSVTANKPVLLMLFAPSHQNGNSQDGVFMALVPPVKQFSNSVTITVPSDVKGFANIVVPNDYCSSPHCSLVVNNSMATISDSTPIYCSGNEVCGQAISVTLPAGVNKLRFANAEAKMGVISHATHIIYDYGTVGGLNLNHIAVRSPEVVITHNADSNSPLKAGGSLELTCTVSNIESLSDELQVTAQWLRGEGGEVISSAPPFEILGETLCLKHSFEALSTEDSNMYKCEVNISSDHSGTLATVSKTTDITVEDECGYLQLVFEGVTKCSNWMLSETEVKAKELSEEVAAIIQKQCSCNFLSEDLTSPTLQCPTSNPDTSNEVLFRACVLKAKDNHLPYSNVTTYLEEARGTSFSFKGLLLTISNNEQCPVKIDSLDPAHCFGSVGGVREDESGNTAVTVSSVVASCVVVIVLGLAVLVVVGVVITHRHTISKQRPKSIHLHHSGDSVTRFSPAPSGGSSYNLYAQRGSNPSNISTPSTQTSPLHQNGFSNASIKEEEQNFETMKTDVSRTRSPSSVSFSDV